MVFWGSILLGDNLSLFVTAERAKDLADKVGGQALTLAEIENFHPEEGMILANTTSVGMKPKINDTPIPKVCPIAKCCNHP